VNKHESNLQVAEPLVTVLIPVRQAGQFLSDALTSIVNQSYRNLEILLVDDGSPDDARDIINKFDDPRIIMLRDGLSLGVTTRLNQGLDLARGKYIARMDADDIAAADRIERQVRFMERNTEVAVVGTAAALIDQHNRVIGAPRRSAFDDLSIKWRLITSNCIVHPATMLRARVVREYRYAADYPVAQDYELWLRLAANGFCLANLPEVLLLNRHHGDAVSTVRRQQQMELSAKALVLYLKNTLDLDIDQRLAHGLLQPPGLRNSADANFSLPIDLLRRAASLFILKSGSSGSRTLQRFVESDIAFYALRSTARSIYPNAPRAHPVDFMLLKQAVGTVFANLSSIARQSIRYPIDKRSAVVAGRKIISGFPTSEAR